MRVASLGWLIPMLLLSGALGAPYLRGEIPFESVEREYFDAFAVSRQTGAASEAPLVLRVNVVGDAADADFSRAAAWLRDNANVELVEDPRGAPLFLTDGDLAATSGRRTLGATVRAGMAVEVSNEALGSCVLAHEALHFLGLKHVDDPRNIMFAHCSKSQLDHAVIEDWQLTKLAEIEKIQATTPRGVHTWALR